MIAQKPNTIASIKHICWGMLFHMLGLGEDADNSFQNLTVRDKYKKLADLIHQHRELFGSQDREDRSQNYNEMIKQVGVILDPEHMVSKFPQNPSGSLQESDDVNYFNISKECDRSDKERHANDDRYHGYSRDPFKKIEEIHKPSVALAAITYLVRAHALFFSRPRTKRDFNAAKVSLNDLFQAGQLGARLYYSLPACHIKKGTQKEYFEDIRQYTYTEDSKPWDSPFYVWWVMEMVEIQRANIYRAIHFLEEADRYYGHAQKRFDRLCTNHLRVADLCIINNVKPDHTDKWLVTPTLASALFESSKVVFDRGLYIESIMNQLRCLAYLIRMPWKGSSNGQTTSSEIKGVLEDLQRALLFLDAVRKQYVWDTKLILKRFRQDEPDQRTSDKISPARVISFLTKLPTAQKKLASELFARLGFTLWGFQHTRDDASWLLPYYKTHEDLQVAQSSLSKYLLCTLFSKDESTDEKILQDSVERQFAQRLREAIGSDNHGSLDKNAFFRKITTTVTNNIINIVTIPRRLQSFLMRPGYKERRARGDLSRKTVYDSYVYSLERNKQPSKAGDIPNKFVILRRWQSFNPKIPRPRLSRVKGGGYFLLWQGRGIVIDPGFDFIQNFYEEGFSLSDIDAIIVTHSHPDHDDDLSTLIVLAREWNEYHERMGHKESYLVKLDLFLNESSHLKFAAWLKASKVGIGRIIPLPLVVWNNDSKSSKPNDSHRGKNVFIHLRDRYSLDLEVVPAWHDDILSSTAAVGLKFHLYDKGDLEKEIGIIGLTGDTGVYPAEGSDSKSTISIQKTYKNCDVLVAHLGDIKLREIFSVVNGEQDLQDSTIEVLKDWFCNKKGGVDIKKVTQERVEAFYNLLVVLGIPDEELFAAKLKFEGDRELIISKCLNSYIEQGTIDLPYPVTAGDLRMIMNKVRVNGDIEEVNRGISKVFSEIKPKPKSVYQDRAKAGYKYKKDGTVVEQKELVFILLGFLCASSYRPWNYEYHLGLSGIWKLYQEMCVYKEKKDRNRIFIVGELPEELSSYRHYVARYLRLFSSNRSNNEKIIYTFTGDIGLHIGLSSPERMKLTPKIRCAFCNYNNETVLRKYNYHDPDKIKETALRRLESSMIYLCTRHDHQPEGEEVTYDFLSSPNLRVI